MGSPLSSIRCGYNFRPDLGFMHQTLADERPAGHYIIELNINMYIWRKKKKNDSSVTKRKKKEYNLLCTRIMMIITIICIMDKEWTGLGWRKYIDLTNKRCRRNSPGFFCFFFLFVLVCATVSGHACYVEYVYIYIYKCLKVELIKPIPIL